MILIKKKKEPKPRTRAKSISGKYYVCLMQTSIYQIIFRPRAKDGVFIAYGPWDYDKCGWWLRMINNHIKSGDVLDISRYEARRFDKNKPKTVDSQRTAILP